MLLPLEQFESHNSIYSHLFLETLQRVQQANSLNNIPQQQASSLKWGTSTCKLSIDIFQIRVANWIIENIGQKNDASWNIENVWMQIMNCFTDDFVSPNALG